MLAQLSCVATNMTLASSLRPRQPAKSTNGESTLAPERQGRPERTGVSTSAATAGAGPEDSRPSARPARPAGVNKAAASMAAADETRDDGCKRFPTWLGVLGARPGGADPLGGRDLGQPTRLLGCCFAGNL
jgi:hypothetical protein